MIWIIYCVTAALLAATLLPFINRAHGFIRILEFPRIQLAIIAALFLILSFLFIPLNTANSLAIACLTAVLVVQSAYIVQFTPIWRARTAGPEELPPGAPKFRLLISNVKQSNRHFDRVTRLLKEEDPDIAIFVETDQAWADALAEACGGYEYVMAYPQSNTYGMMLFSKFPLTKSRIRFLIMEDVPSFDAIVQVDGPHRFRLFAIHPEPPIVHRESAPRDGEISLAGEILRDEEAPVIVCGDLNDVAWSRLTMRFLRISSLLDPRRGRGTYCTFDARFFFLRWPLDHAFCSSEFRVVDMRRLPTVGSDHFPIRFDLALTGDKSPSEPQEPADSQDFKRANSVIRRGRKADREPVGSDWE